VAEVDLDSVIRSLAKAQSKALMDAAKKRRDVFLARAGAAKATEAKARFKEIAKAVMEHGAAAAKRLQVSADNTADSYARAVKKAAEAKPVEAPKPPAPKKPDSKPTKVKAKPNKVGAKPKKAKASASRA
jgi:hypothetical protein